MQDLIQDIRYAVRTLLQSPGFAAVAIVTLALGIGANSAIFSVVNGVVITPLPYAAPERLMFITSAFPTLDFDEFWMSQPEYMEYRELSQSFEEIGAFRTGEVSITGAESPIRVTAGFTTHSFMTVLGVDAARGRYYTAEEDTPEGDPVVVIAWELWQRAFGGREDLVGSTIEVDGTTRTIVGIMPPGFDILDSGVEAWVPYGLDPVNRRPRGNHFLYAVGRLRSDTTREQAQAELDTLLASWRERVPEGHVPSPDTHRLQMEPLQEKAVGEVRPALLLLLGAVGFVLLIACANVGNLLLARSESRQKEIAIRTAIGAGRGRLLRQFLTESVLLALIGGVAGLLLGNWGVSALLAASPDSIPRVTEVGIDPQVMLFTLAVSIVTGLLFGLAPMMHLTIHSMNTALREGGERATAGSARHRLRRLLVVSEIAMAVVLVICAGLMLRSFASLQDVDPGFESEGLMTFRLFLPPASYPDPQSQMTFYNQLVERLEAAPGVTAATAMNGLPPLRPVNANDTEFEGLERTEDGPPHNVDYWQFVTDGYFETMRIPIVEGRAFSAQDMSPEGMPVVLVNETMAKTFWPDESSIGRRVRPPGNSNPWLTVVGVVKDVKQDGLENETGTELYFFVPQVARIGFFPRTMNVVLRTEVPPASLAGAAREAVWSLDGTLPLADLQTMGDVLYRSVATPRFLTLLLTLFACVALTLAAVGTYGVMSYSVAERGHEIGIRMALGAEPGGVLSLVLGEGIKLAAVGVAAGLLASFGLTRFMSTILYAVTSTDLVTFVAVPVVLVLVAVLAVFIPARRATRVDPIVVLRS
jgi:putative ABC transport system permease protein